MRHRTALGLVVLLTAISAGAQRAQAGLRFCNKSAATIEVAIGYADRGRGWVSEGWLMIDSGQCKDAIRSPLSNRYYFYYAMSRDGTKFSGETPFCIETKAFTLRQSQYGRNTEADCTQAGLRFAKFRIVDVQNSRNHTLTVGTAPSAGPAPQVGHPPAIAGGSAPPRAYQPPAAAPQQQPATPPPAAGGGAACQRYPNLC